MSGYRTARVLISHDDIDGVDDDGDDNYDTGKWRPW